MTVSHAGTKYLVKTIKKISPLKIKVAKLLVDKQIVLSPAPAPRPLYYSYYGSRRFSDTADTQFACNNLQLSSLCFPTSSLNRGTPAAQPPGGGASNRVCVFDT